MMGPRRFGVLVLCCAVMRAQAPLAQVPVDPYTGGEAEALKRAGYVSLGPFPFGPNHTTAGVEGLLGDEPLHWIETAHFRLGCAVSEVALRGADSAWIKQVKGELQRLRERLPTVKRSPRTLDPWLRTHLIAQRLEECYAEIQRDLGVDDGGFPTEPMDPGDEKAYLGVGPYLGMAQKYSVLVLQRGASLARYTRAYAGGETIEPFRFHATGYGGLFFVVCEESSNGLMKNDHALHTQLVYNVVVNLINGYRYYAHDMPPWLLFGLAHYYSRQVSPRYPAYERKIEGEPEDSPFWKWDERARGLLKYEAFEPLATLMARGEIGEFGMEEHIEAWFLVDYLMSTRRAATMQLVHELKAPFHNQYKLPTTVELEARQTAAIERLFGIDIEGLEAEWRAGAGKRSRR
ncbi:MAG: hypothetical protein KDE27_11190 [Planctomycetes bacterium]|nr:hypothetical protein [Planctomycetota bacterium]